jgi:hypothetical protein
LVMDLPMRGRLFRLFRLLPTFLLGRCTITVRLTQYAAIQKVNSRFFYIKFRIFRVPGTEVPIAFVLVRYNRSGSVVLRAWKLSWSPKFESFYLNYLCCCIATQN